ncbi:MAG: hypothetical protein NTZ36_01120 [Candidatus Jorgensenbacteria bacterium]|nr:hypothetical protein [Candidatus Jorgensenbacteria bacterium]
MDEFKTLEEFKSGCGYEIDTGWYPRVTRILEIKAKPALYRFYGKVSSFAEGERIKNQSAVEGTLIHETAEKIFLNQPVDVPESIEASISALRNFMSEKKIHVDPEYVEARLVNHEHRYAGTLDAIALIDGKLGILDIKTSQEIYRDYNLQTSAYLAAMKDDVKGLETRWILRIDQSRPCIFCGGFLRNKGGRPQIKIQWNDPVMRSCRHEWGAMQGHIELKESPYWQEDFTAFLGAKKLWEWENAEWLTKAGYLK